MITVFFGQPSSGKTTLANEYAMALELENPYIALEKIDGDNIRNLFLNTD